MQGACVRTVINAHWLLYVYTRITHAACARVYAAVTPRPSRPRISRAAPFPGTGCPGIAAPPAGTRNSPQDLPSETSLF